MLGAGFVQFNGSGAINVTFTANDIKNNFTYEFWVKPDQEHRIHAQSVRGVQGVQGQRPVIGACIVPGKENAGAGISVGLNGVSIFEHADGYLPATLVYETEIHDWTHVAVVYRDKTPHLYINGKLRKKGLTSIKENVFLSGMIGALEPYGFYSGLLDELRIWDHARTERQIQGNRFKELYWNEPGLFAYYKLNEGLGDIVHDCSVHGNHGFLSGVTIWQRDEAYRQELGPLPCLGVTEYDRVALVISHSNYLRSLAGTEKYIHEQSTFLEQEGCKVIQIFPAGQFPFHGQDRVRYGINASKSFRGFYDIEEIVSLLNELPRLDFVFIHHLLYWQRTDFAKLLPLIKRNGVTSAYFAHDYHSCCPSIQLLYYDEKGNQHSCTRELLNDPRKVHCDQCPHAAYMEQWRKQYESIFADVDHIIAPSAIALSILKQMYPMHGHKMQEWKHLQFIALETVPKQEAKQRKLRLAYLGYKSPIKGWAAWAQIIHNRHLQQIYDFYHIGSPEYYSDIVTCCEYSFIKDGNMAAVHCLQKHEIDLVLLWSTWAETYSYTVHEAIAAGIPVLTCSESGNIAHALHENHSAGQILNSEAELLTFLMDHSKVEGLLNQPKRQYLLKYNPPPFMLRETEMVVFTSICANYLPKARILAKSLKETNRKVKMTVCLLEEDMPDGARDGGCFDEVVLAKHIGFDDFYPFMFKHNIVEASTAIKGRLFSYLMHHHQGVDKFVYLDPDIRIYGPLNELMSALDDHQIVLTPHLLQPEDHPDAVRDNEINSLKYGVFNLGFLAVKRSQQADKFLNWWSSRLALFCRDDLQNGLFTDQKWMDLAPVFFDIHVLKHPGYNVAPWNLSHRLVTFDEGGPPTVHGVPLRFFHYSGLDSGANEAMINKYVPDRSQPMQRLREQYIRDLEEMGQSHYGAMAWSYDYYTSGEKIVHEARSAYRRDSTMQNRHPNPFLESNAVFVGS